MIRRLLLAGLVVLSACSGGMPTGRLQGVVIENPTPKPSFVLSDTDGNVFDFAERTAGKMTLLYFGYTFCPDICPVHMAQISEVFREFPALARNAVVVFVTVDPDRDTNDVLGPYVASFGPQFVALTGTLEELEVAQKAAGVPVAVISGEGPTYAVDHSSVVLAYGPDDLHHSTYPFGTRQSVWANDLRILGSIGSG